MTVRQRRAGHSFRLEIMNPNYLEFEQPIAELEMKIEELQLVSRDNDLNIAEEIGRLKEKSTRLTEKVFSGLKPWDIVRVARHRSEERRVGKEGRSGGAGSGCGIKQDE